MAEGVQLSEPKTVEEFLKNDRPLWPQIPTACPVTQCDQTKKFQRFSDFMEHWKNIHNETCTIFKCKLCKKLFATVKHKKSHEKCNFHKGQSVQFEIIDKGNDAYVDPKGILPYQIGTPTFRKDMRQLQRELQSTQRKLDALEWQSKTTELSEEETRYHICRDERVVERNGVVFKDTNMWSPPSRRKRIRLSKD